MNILFFQVQLLCLITCINILIVGSKTCCHPQKNHAYFFSHLCQALKDLNNAVRGKDHICNFDLNYFSLIILSKD